MNQTEAEIEFRNEMTKLFKNFEYTLLCNDAQKIFSAPFCFASSQTSFSSQIKYCHNLQRIQI